MTTQAFSTRQAILEAEGYRVISARDGEDALELFDTHPVVELVLLDYAMPGLDGCAVTRDLTARKPWVPIFMVSSHEARLSQMILSTIDVVIPKGLGPEDLSQTIRELRLPRGAGAHMIVALCR